MAYAAHPLAKTKPVLISLLIGVEYSLEIRMESTLFNSATIIWTPFYFSEANLPFVPNALVY